MPQSSHHVQNTATAHLYKSPTPRRSSIDMYKKTIDFRNAKGYSSNTAPPLHILLADCGRCEHQERENCGGSAARYSQELAVRDQGASLLACAAVALGMRSRLSWHAQPSLLACAAVALGMRSRRSWHAQPSLLACRTDDKNSPHIPETLCNSTCAFAAWRWPLQQ